MVWPWTARLAIARPWVVRTCVWGAGSFELWHGSGRAVKRLHTRTVHERRRGGPRRGARPRRAAARRRGGRRRQPPRRIDGDRAGGTGRRTPGSRHLAGGRAAVAATRSTRLTVRRRTVHRLGRHAVAVGEPVRVLVASVVVRVGRGIGMPRPVASPTYVAIGGGIVGHQTSSNSASLCLMISSR